MTEGLTRKVREGDACVTWKGLILLLIPLVSIQMGATTYMIQEHKEHPHPTAVHQLEIAPISDRITKVESETKELRVLINTKIDKIDSKLDALILRELDKN